MPIDLSSPRASARRRPGRIGSRGRSQGWPSIPPERLIRASLIQILFSLRLQRKLMWQMQYNFPFPWFVRLNRFHHRREVPARQQLGDLTRQLIHRGRGIGDGIEFVLDDDLLGRMLEAHHRQPAPIGHRPAILPGIDATVAQQKSLKILPRLLLHEDNRVSHGTAGMKAFA